MASLGLSREERFTPEMGRRIETAARVRVSVLHLSSPIKTKRAPPTIAHRCLSCVFSIFFCRWRSRNERLTCVLSILVFAGVCIQFYVVSDKKVGHSTIMSETRTIDPSSDNTNIYDTMSFIDGEKNVIEKHFDLFYLLEFWRGEVQALKR